MRGKVVLITGASSGIGAGAAVLFASRGCLLSLTGRSQEGLDDTKKACIEAGAKDEDTLLIAADLLNHERLVGMVDSTMKKFGKLDVLVNNAGGPCVGTLEDVTVENYDTAMNTNVKAMFFLTQLAMPHLIQSQGSVVNVSSVFSYRPNASAVVYGMSKAAVDHFTRIVALDVASKNVRVNAVNPGGVKTQFLARRGFTGNVDELMRKVHAMGRPGEIEEIAKAILFLADNEQSSFVTGVTLLVDGGAVLKGPM